MNRKELGEAVKRNREMVRRDIEASILGADTVAVKGVGSLARYIESLSSNRDKWVKPDPSTDAQDTSYQSDFYHPYTYHPHSWATLNDGDPSYSKNPYIERQKENPKGKYDGITVSDHTKKQDIATSLPTRDKESAEREAAERINASLTAPVVDEPPAPLPVAPIEAVRQLNSLFDIDPTPRMGWQGNK